MKAGIFAAGMGSRFAQAGWKEPKPLIALHGKPLLGHVLERLFRSGVEEVELLLNEESAFDPVETYVKKGGRLADTEGRKCLCNALMSNLDRGQVRSWGTQEDPLLTSGDDLEILGEFLNGRDRYTAADVLDYLLS